MNKVVVILLTMSLLTSCATGGGKQTGGTLIGGASGALIGSQFGKGHGRLAAVGIGTLAGAFIGGGIGKNMDDRDRAMAQRTAQRALESQPDHAVSTWRNPNNHHRGNFVVTNTREDKRNNLVCRDFVHTVIIDGQNEKVHGRACRDIRDPRGTWEIKR